MQTRWISRSALFTDDTYDVYTREQHPPEQSAARAPLHDASALSDLDAQGGAGGNVPRWGALRRRNAGNVVPNEAMRADDDVKGVPLGPSGAHSAINRAFEAAPGDDAAIKHMPQSIPARHVDFVDASDSFISASFYTACGDSVISELPADEVRRNAVNADFGRPDANAVKEPTTRGAGSLEQEVHALVSAVEREKERRWAGSDALGAASIDKVNDDVVSAPPPIVVAKAPQDGARFSRHA